MTEKKMKSLIKLLPLKKKILLQFEIVTENCSQYVNRQVILNEAIGHITAGNKKKTSYEIREVYRTTEDHYILRSYYFYGHGNYWNNYCELTGYNNLWNLMSSLEFKSRDLGEKDNFGYKVNRTLFAHLKKHYLPKFKYNTY